MKLLILCAVFQLIYASSISDRCKLKNAGECLMIRTRFMEEHATTFPTNEKELIRLCQILQEMRNCLYNFTNVCMTTMDKIVFDFSFSGTREKMDNLCNPQKQAYKDYVEDAECIKYNMGEISSCFRDNLASSEYMLEDTSGRKFLIFCCGLNRLKRCIFDHYQSKCNKKVATLMAMQVEFLLSEWVVEMCDSIAETEDCPILPTKNELKGTYKPGYVVNLIAAFSKEN